jgi:hypothetical protein
VSIPEDETLGLIAMAMNPSPDPNQDKDYHWAQACLELRVGLARLLDRQAEIVKSGQYVNGTHMAIGITRSLGDVLFDLQAATSIPARHLVALVKDRIDVIQREVDTGKAVIEKGQLRRLDKKPVAN